jgi:hypothetical protein
MSNSSNMKADVSMFYVLREFPNFLIFIICPFLEIF